MARRIKGNITDLSGNHLLYNQDNPHRDNGMILSLTEGLEGISHQKIVSAINFFTEKYGHPLLEPATRNGVSIYNNYEKCITNPNFFV